MKKLVMLVAVFVSLAAVSVYAADSSQFIDICKEGGIAAIQSMLTTGTVDVNAVRVGCAAHLCIMLQGVYGFVGRRVHLAP